jgi:chaperonin GroES
VQNAAALVGGEAIESDNSFKFQFSTKELSMKLRPLGDKVVVKRVEAEERTSGGILLPDTAKEKPQRGKVISVGPGKLLDDGKRAAPAVKAGDQVLFTSYAGTEVKVANEEFLVMDESDIMAILD